MAHPDRFGQPSATALAYYYLELRTGRGVDTGLAPSVQVRVSGDIQPPSDANHHSWILDMVPSTTDLEGLGAGDSFSDPAGGLTIRVETLGADGATIAIDLANDGGGPLCLGGAELTAPGPAIESCGALPARAATDGGSGAGGAGGAGADTGGGGGAGTDDGGRGGADEGMGGGGGGCGCAVASASPAIDLLSWACFLAFYVVGRRHPVRLAARPRRCENGIGPATAVRPSCRLRASRRCRGAGDPACAAA